MTSHNRATQTQRKLVSQSGSWRWDYESGTASLPGPAFGSTPSSSMISQWEREQRRPVTRFLSGALNGFRRYVGKFVALTVVFLLGATLASGPNSTAVNFQLRDKLESAETRLTARQGELELVRMEVSRLNSIVDHSRRYKIPADLAASIYDISLSEGIDPKIAFALVSVESDFLRKAVSNKGAVGLTQMMPATARILDPSLDYTDLFDSETNLRLGFRFLREMLNYYDGDLSLALTAYNRGPTRVDEIRKAGGDPSNGYSQAVMGGGQ
ncbi:MAG: lytic transglycosylase domain-containing protein [Longimicrobiales bacterium]